MKEKELIKLGFEKNFVTAEESGDSEYYYLTYDIGTICLISTSNDENDDDYGVEIFNEDKFIFKNIDEVKSIIEILEKSQM